MAESDPRIHRHFGGVLVYPTIDDINADASVPLLQQHKSYKTTSFDRGPS